MWLLCSKILAAWIILLQCWVFMVSDEKWEEQLSRYRVIDKGKRSLTPAPND